MASLPLGFFTSHSLSSMVHLSLGLRILIKTKRDAQDTESMEQITHGSLLDQNPQKAIES